MTNRRLEQSSLYCLAFLTNDHYNTIKSIGFILYFLSLSHYLKTTTGVPFGTLAYTFGITFGGVLIHPCEPNPSRQRVPP